MPIQDEESLKKVVKGPNYKVIHEQTATPNTLKHYFLFVPQV